MDEKTSLSAYKKDFTQTNIYNDEEVMTGKSYLFPALEAERTIYIKAPIATIAEPVVWKIEAEGDGEGIDDIKDNLIVTIYPNPTDGLFYVNVPTAVDGSTVAITTLSGSTLYTAPLTNGLNIINLSGRLIPGIYLVVTNSNNQSITSKLIIR